MCRRQTTNTGYNTSISMLAGCGTNIAHHMQRQRLRPTKQTDVQIYTTALNYGWASDSQLSAKQLQLLLNKYCGKLENKAWSYTIKATTEVKHAPKIHQCSSQSMHWNNTPTQCNYYVQTKWVITDITFLAYIRPQWSTLYRLCIRSIRYSSSAVTGSLQSISKLALYGYTGVGCTTYHLHIS